MADRPMLFSAAMVRALLDGRKTQTRRILKPQPTITSAGLLVWERKDYLLQGTPDDVAHAQRITNDDSLWVRETWQGLTFGDYRPTKHQPCEVRYFATDPCADLDGEARGYQWRPSIFMPRWASRITLDVTKVRVQRLQDISEQDAVAEGCFKGNASGRVFASEGAIHLGGDEWANARDWYADLWDSLNGEGAWEANPWIAAYTFTVIAKNIDEVTT